MFALTSHGTSVAVRFAFGTKYLHQNNQLSYLPVITGKKFLHDFPSLRSDSLPAWCYIYVERELALNSLKYINASKKVCAFLVFVVNEENLSESDQLIMKFIPAKSYKN